MQAGSAPDMYVMICGRVTPTQRDIIKRKCTINGLDYNRILSWLIDNHPSYHGMQKPDYYPQPILVGGFEEQLIIHILVKIVYQRLRTSSKEKK